MSNFPEVNVETFQAHVAQAHLPVLVDFSAPWCTPCRRLDPLLEQLSREWENKVTFIKVNVDESPELVVKYQVMSVPTLIMFRNSQEVARLIGLQTREKLIERFLPV